MISNFIFNPAYSVFSIALLVMIGITLIEVLSTIVGASASSSFDHALNAMFHIDAGHIDISHAEHSLGDHDAEATGVISNAIGWLNVGRTPMLILLICFLAMFSAVGYSITEIVMAVFPLPAFLMKWITVPCAFIGAIYFTRTSSRFIGRIIPRDETSALDESDMVGLVGEVVIGPVQSGETAKAVFYDKFMTMHRIFVEPMHPEDVIPQGEKVLIVQKEHGKSAMVIKAENRISVQK